MIASLLIRHKLKCIHPPAIFEPFIAVLKEVMINIIEIFFYKHFLQDSFYEPLLALSEQGPEQTPELELSEQTPELELGVLSLCCWG